MAFDAASEVNTSGIDVGKLISLAQFSQQMQRQQEAIKNENALKALFMQPNAMDPNTGMINPKVVQQALAIDPDTGLKLQETNLTAQLKAAELKHTETETGKASWDYMTTLAGAAVDTYDDAIKSGKNPQEAAAAAKAFRDGQAKNNGGVLSDAQVDQLEGAPFDYNSAKGLARMNKEYVSSKGEAERERHDETMEGLGAQRLNVTVADQQGSKWQILTDPSKKDAQGNPVQYRYNPETTQATTLDGAPFQPGGAQKIGSGGQGDDFTPQMGDVMAALAEKGVSLPTGMRSKAQQVKLYEGLLRDNPGKSPDEIADMIKKGQIEFGAQKKETQTAAAVAGKVEVFANELKKDIPLVRAASADLQRSNFKTLNDLIQTVDSEISDPKLKTLKGYIRATLNAYDGLSARGGTDQDKRAENRQQLLSAEGDRAINAALDVIEKESEIAHESSVEATRVPELSEDSESKSAKGTSDIATPTSKAEFDALPKGTRYRQPGDPKDAFRVKGTLGQ
jgi:hypothetical protein